MGAFRSIAIVGAGLVGSGWAIVFARSGASVSVYDADAAIRGSVLDRIEASLEEMRAVGLVEAVAPVLARITVADTLADAVRDADYVQESVFERTDVKTAISLEIDASMRPDAVVGSSSSGIPASAFTEGCRNRARFLIAHPVNPPHLVPLVELVPAPWTDPAIVPVLRAEMEAAGQVAIVVNREIEGFILNRLQGALLNEAWALYESGYASAADIDATVAHGLGLRWSFMGPFETIDLNAPGGVADYARRLGPLYHSVALDRTAPRPWSDDLVARVETERRALLPQADLAARRAWRDARLMRLVAHKRQTAKEAGP
ncbi:3-hydroxyacyl-CoA dehydrogenase [Prosthecomicrobium pneumaticum]|uniref:3-hydroxyacyl-CoA dehydrogenase n=1 Tax=Prosthecomicrobium pneumaticum TaxID=81895 RepID=A0A7W9FMK4_9HYPH|nr:3-hydroxyacyl-CoA dehydrogenase [Prosthecomicrobium pneumaticum]MBB5753435.1 3-hydroxyacyl-CoA dehydrogenase [Prosthecomicrobium pneumaticum]